MQRYWGYECQLAVKIQALKSTTYTVKQLNTAVERYFPKTTEIDWQKEAAKAAVSRAFTIITGGPGTGKTTTVVKILALLQDLAVQPLNIALIAPTGKAAMRLQESIGQSKQGLACSAAIKQLIPEKVVTIHRLLGAKPPSPYFRYNHERRLPYDIVVVDESSMIDLALMAKLVNALKGNVRLILLGDKDQLSSVETGTVLADLSAALPDCTQALKKSYRFSGHIKKLATAINEQQAEQAWQLLSDADNSVSLLTENVTLYIAEQYSHYLQLLKQQADFKTIYAAFNRFQVLCATRLSVDDINQHVLGSLKQQGLIQQQSDWYAGRPVMMTRNNPILQLYNGDIGICLPDTEKSGQLMVFFLLPNGDVRKYLPARLSACETVFAMTIHKSQGSEFNEVLLVLPEVLNPILTKELIYTGMTRTKENLKVLTTKEIFVASLMRKVERQSGLAARLMA